MHLLSHRSDHDLAHPMLSQINRLVLRSFRRYVGLQQLPLFCLIQNKRVGPIGLLPSRLVVDHIYICGHNYKRNEMVRSRHLIVTLLLARTWLEERDIYRAGRSSTVGSVYAYILLF